MCKVSKFISVSLGPGVMRKRDEGTEVTKICHDDIRPVYQEKFADCGISRNFTDQIRFLFLRRVTTIWSIRCWMYRKI